SPVFCLSAIAFGIVVIALLSGMLRMTRAVVLPLPYADGERIATVSQGLALLATRSGVRADWVPSWRENSRALADAASYTWPAGPVPTARVSSNFFVLLGASTTDGRVLDNGAFIRCPDCVVLSHDFWRRHFRGGPLTPASRISLDGRERRIAGVLQPRF